MHSARNCILTHTQRFNLSYVQSLPSQPHLHHIGMLSLSNQAAQASVLSTLGSQGFPTAGSPVSSRHLATSPSPLELYTSQDGLSYMQATSPQPASFGHSITVSSVGHSLAVSHDNDVT